MSGLSGLGKLTGVSSAPGVRVTAFGKHPGWDDHVDALGDQGPLLAELRAQLYDQGIAGNIDAGQWDKPGQPDEARLRPFGHVLLSATGGGGAGASESELVVARLWPSRDGRGRTRYPMVAAASCVGVGADAALSRVLPQLQVLEEALRGAGDAAAARRAVDEAGERLRSIGPGTGAEAIGAGAMGALLDRAEFGPERRGLLRVLYQVRTEMGAFLRGSKGEAPAQGRAIRLPMSRGVAHDRALGEAYALVRALVRPGVRVTVIRPLEDDWVDVVVGSLSAGAVACLRQGASRLAPSTEIPYSVGEDDRAALLALLGVKGAGRAELAAAPGVAGREEEGKSSMKLVLILLGALLLAAGAAGAWWLMNRPA
jgi:hypothetical protein